MSNTGKQLESLVEQIEKLLLPDNFTIKTNEKILNDEGVQIAEFDIEIEGRLGSTYIKWLIECRDRPSSGSAPGSWIEQLVGRRDRFGFNKVTAVSTTGFADGAVDYAREARIELRTVKEITFEEISDWFSITYITLFRQYGDLRNAILIIDPGETEKRKKAFDDTVKASNADTPFLLSRSTGRAVSAVKAFLAVTNQHSELFNGIRPDGASRNVRLKVDYPNDNNHFFIATEEGDIRITKIIFDASLYIKSEIIPIEKIIRYSSDEEDKEIASIVGFKFNIEEQELGLEFHKLADTGETHMLLRKLEK